MANKNSVLRSKISKEFIRKGKDAGTHTSRKKKK